MSALATMLDAMTPEALAEGERELAELDERRAKLRYAVEVMRIHLRKDEPAPAAESVPVEENIPDRPLTLTEERRLAVARFLEGGNRTFAEIVEGAAVPKGAMTCVMHWPWFRKLEYGRYGLTAEGREALEAFAEPTPCSP